MKRTLILLVVTWSCFTASAAPSPKWHDQTCWDKLSKGLTPNEVSLLLGLPAAKDTAPRAMIYYYQKTPEKGSPKPSCGIVRFRGIVDRRTNRTSFVLHDFAPPEWDLVERPAPKKSPELIAAEQKAANLQAQLDAQARIAERTRLAKLREQEIQRQQTQQIVALARQEQPTAEQATPSPPSDKFNIILWARENTFLVSIIVGTAFVAIAFFLAAFARKSWH